MTAAEVLPGDVYRGGSGEPLLLLHGLSSSWRAWSPVLHGLQRRRTVVALTLAGHRGGAPWPAGCPTTVGEVTSAVERRLDELGLGQVDVVGNSLGGWIALELAHRGRARSVVALSPAGAWATPADARRLIRLLGFVRRGTASAPAWQVRLMRRPRARKLLLRMACEHGDRMPASEVPGLFEDAAACTIFDELVGSVLQQGQVRPLPDPPCPITIAWGEHDRLLPIERYGRPMFERFPTARHLVLPGVGHAPMIDDPDLVVRTVLEGTAAAEQHSDEANGRALRSGGAGAPKEAT